MKNLFITLILFISFFAVSSSVFAENNEKLESDLDKEEKYEEEKIDKKLKKLEYPEELISIMPIEQKQDIIDSNPVKFGGLEKTDYYYDENGEMQEIKTDGISVMATIPRTELTLWNSRSYLGKIGGRATYRVYVNWEWKVGTTFNYVDKIGLSYNSPFQTRVSNNGNYSCRSYTKSTDSTYKISDTCGGRPSEISFGGAAWNFDKKYGSQMRSYGYAQMDIETKDTTSPTGTGILLSKYFHKVGFSGSLGASIGYASISIISGGTSYDEAASQSSWNY